MGNVKIEMDKASDAREAAARLHKVITETHTSCTKLLSYIEGAKWSGKTRDSFISYLEIIEKYHKDLDKALSKQVKALENLEGYISDYQNDGKVREVRNL